MTSVSALRLSVFALLCACIIAHPTSHTYYAPRSQASSSTNPLPTSCAEPRASPTVKPASPHTAPSEKYNAHHTSGTQSKPSANYASSEGTSRSKSAINPVQQFAPAHAPSQKFAPAPAPTHNINHATTTNPPSATVNPRPVIPGSSIELENVSASATGNNSMSVGAEKDRAAAAGNAGDGNIIMAAAAPGQAMGIISPATPMF